MLCKNESEKIENITFKKNFRTSLENKLLHLNLMAVKLHNQTKRKNVLLTFIEKDHLKNDNFSN